MGGLTAYLKGRKGWNKYSGIVYFTLFLFYTQYTTLGIGQAQGTVAVALCIPSQSACSEMYFFAFEYERSRSLPLEDPQIRNSLWTEES